MTRKQAVEFIHSTNGRYFTCEFIKRTTGELRVMLCRLGVKSRLKGGEQPYDPKAYNLITVFDVQRDSYRTIPVEGLRRIKVHGKWEQIR